MKKVIISTIITAGILLSGRAQAGNIDSVVEGKLVNICEAIKSNSVIKVNAAISDSGLNMNQITDDLVCNGYDPISFAMVNEAERTAQYMAKKSNVELVASL